MAGAGTWLSRSPIWLIAVLRCPGSWESDSPACRQDVCQLAHTHAAASACVLCQVIQAAGIASLSRLQLLAPPAGQLVLRNRRPACWQLKQVLDESCALGPSSPLLQTQVCCFTPGSAAWPGGRAALGCAVAPESRRTVMGMPAASGSAPASAPAAAAALEPVAVPAVHARASAGAEHHVLLTPPCPDRLALCWQHELCTCCCTCQTAMHAGRLEHKQSAAGCSGWQRLAPEPECGFDRVPRFRRLDSWRGLPMALHSQWCDCNVGAQGEQAASGS